MKRHLVRGEEGDNGLSSDQAVVRAVGSSCVYVSSCVEVVDRTLLCVFVAGGGGGSLPACLYDILK